MNLRLGDALRAAQEIEVAALVGLADMLGKHRAVAARIFGRRRPPGGAPARKLLLADVQMDASRGDVDLDLVARMPAGRRQNFPGPRAGCRLIRITIFFRLHLIDNVAAQLENQRQSQDGRTQ